VPNLIAICGHPGAGKTTVQDSLTRQFGVTPVDDGYILRNFARSYLGATYADVHTQEGKRRKMLMVDEEMEWRQFLGRLGNALEDEFGEHALPFMTVNNTLREAGEDEWFSFGSVRKTQGAYYRALGGIVLEVENPSVGPSGNAFDLYDQSLVTHSLLNEGKSLEELDKAVYLWGCANGLPN